MPIHENLATALAAFQAELPSLRKDETGKVQGTTDDGRKYSYDYGYADLAQVVEAVSPTLGKHGLSFTSKPTMTPAGFGLAYALKHESGESDEGFWPLPDPLRTKPQQVGSAITYARRYAQMAVTNTFPDKEDDDGAAAVPAGHRDQAMSPEAFDQLPKERPTRTEQAFDQHRRGVGRTDDPAERETPKPPRMWTDAEVAELHAKLTDLSMDKVGKLYDWMASKDLHNRPIGFSAGASTESTETATQVLALRIADTAILPDTTPEDLTAYRDFADGRGLLKVQVSATETLDEVLHEARELAVHAAVEQAKRETPDPQDM